jgi:hypothetical protein
MKIIYLMLLQSGYLFIYLFIHSINQTFMHLQGYNGGKAETPVVWG